MNEYPGNKKYKIIKKLNEGGFGSTYKVYNSEDHNYYCIKKISIKDKTEEEKNKILQEAKILSKLNNKYIVKYYESFFYDDSFNIIMELCVSDLKKYINEQKSNQNLIDKNLIYNWILEIYLGIKEIHSNNLIHRDLKPENLFLTYEKKIKIGDFGIAKELNNIQEYSNTQIGTLPYMAPEILKNEIYDKKVDIWSLGCIIYELCTLNVCFKSVINTLNCSYGKINIRLYDFASRFNKYYIK